MKKRKPIRIRGAAPAVLWPLSFLAQLFVCSAVIYYGSGWLSEQAAAAAQPYGWLEFPVKLAELLIPALVGFLLGYLVKDLPGIFHEPGRWVSLPPVIVGVALLPLSMLTNLDHLWILLFGLRGTNYSGAGVVGLLFPLGGICMYSLGVRFGDRYTNPLDGAEVDYHNY